MLKRFAPIALAAAMAAPAQANFTGDDFLTVCEEELDTCVALTMAVDSTMGTYQQWEFAPQMYCITSELTYKEVALMFRNYLLANPKERRYSMSSTFILYLADQFPCPAETSDISL